jgi:adenylate cyclase
MRRLIPVLVPLALAAGFLFLAAFNPPAVDEHLETLLVDYRFRLGAVLKPVPPPADLVIVAVDEASLTRFGRWPWSRDLQARLLETVVSGEPRVVAVDLFFPERETPLGDARLAGVFAGNRERMVGAIPFEVEEGRTPPGEVEEVLYGFALGQVEQLSLFRPARAWRALVPPEPIASSQTFGDVYSLADRDGKVRREVLVLEYGGEYFPSLALQAARLYLGLPLAKVRVVGGRGLFLGDLLVPMDSNGRLNVNYYGRERTIPYLSAADLLEGRTPAASLRGKAVFVGTSALSTYDLKVTPFSANMPGVEKNATVMANLVQGRFLRQAPLLLDLGVVLLASAGALAALAPLSATGMSVLFTLLIVGLAAANQVCFTFLGLRLNLVYPLAALVSQGVFIVLYRYVTEERRAREIRRMFSSYVTERVVAEMIRNPDLTRLGGERREVTVLFSDIRGFTTFSEKRAPEEVVAMLNEYLTAMTEIVFRWEGTLDKFIGDAIVAFWGAPLPQEDHAERALRCALQMMRRMDELREKWAAEGKEALHIGIGLNTGEVLVGNIGAEGKKMDYTVIGDNVNLGSRVESLNKRYGSQTLITDLTLARLRPLVDSGRLGHLAITGQERVVVKGKKEPVGLYRLEGLPHGTPVALTECPETVVVLHEK